MASSKRNKEDEDLSLDPEQIASVGHEFAKSILAQPLFAATPACTLGAFFALGQYLLARGASAELPFDTAVRTLRLRGVAEPEDVLSSLEVQLLISMEDGIVEIPLLTEAFEFEAAMNTSRKSKSSPRKFQLIDGEYRLYGGDCRADDTSPILVRIPLKGGAEATITESYLKAEQEAYPAIDVHQAYMNAAKWCEANDAKRKTAVGIRKFLNGWIMRQLERRDVRSAVLATENSRNGFGQGDVRFAPPSSIQGANHPIDGASATVDDDFGMGELLKPRLAVTATQDFVEASAPESSLAARIRRQGGLAQGNPAQRRVGPGKTH